MNVNVNVNVLTMPSPVRPEFSSPSPVRPELSSIFVPVYAGFEASGGNSKKVPNGRVMQTPNDYGNAYTRLRLRMCVLERRWQARMGHEGAPVWRAVCERIARDDGRGAVQGMALSTNEEEMEAPIDEGVVDENWRLQKQRWRLDCVTRNVEKLMEGLAMKYPWSTEAEEVVSTLVDLMSNAMLTHGRPHFVCPREGDACLMNKDWFHPLNSDDLKRRLTASCVFPAFFDGPAIVVPGVYYCWDPFSILREAQQCMHKGDDGGAVLLYRSFFAHVDCAEELKHAQAELLVDSMMELADCLSRLGYREECKTFLLGLENCLRLHTQESLARLYAKEYALFRDFARHFGATDCHAQALVYLVAAQNACEAIQAFPIGQLETLLLDIGETALRATGGTETNREGHLLVGISRLWKGVKSIRRGMAGALSPERERFFVRMLRCYVECALELSRIVGSKQVKAANTVRHRNALQKKGESGLLGESQSYLVRAAEILSNQLLKRVQPESVEYLDLELDLLEVSIRIAAPDGCDVRRLAENIGRKRGGYLSSSQGRSREMRLKELVAVIPLKEDKVPPPASVPSKKKEKPRHCMELPPWVLQATCVFLLIVIGYYIYTLVNTLGF